MKIGVGIGTQWSSLVRVLSTCYTKCCCVWRYMSSNWNSSWISLVW